MCIYRKLSALSAIMGIAVAALISTVAQAGWFPETRLTVAPYASYLSGNNARCLVTDSFGDLHLVWYDYRDGEAEVYYSRFDGTVWGPEAVLTSSEYSSEYPSLAADSAGGLHLVWSRYGAGGGRIHYRHFNGTVWEPAQIISDYAQASERPSVAVDDSGRVHVVWREYGGGTWRIYHSMNDGTAWSPAYLLCDPAGYPRYASTAAGSSGQVHVAWDDYRHGNWEIYYRRLDAAAWDPEERLTSDVGASESPAMVVDTFGSVHVFWDDDRGDTTTIYHKMNAGSGWSPDEAVVAPVEFAVEPRAVAGDSGCIHITWYDEAGYAEEVYYQEFDGSAWLPKERISVNNAISRNPDVAVGGDGVVHVVWHDNRLWYNFEIYWRAKRDIPKPEIISIEPDSHYTFQDVHISELAGSGFFTGTEVRLEMAGESGIDAANVTVESDTRITCDFSLRAEGHWDVIVENMDNQADTLVAGFHVLPLPKPEIVSIDPDSGYAYQQVHITDLAGAGFFPGAEVRLKKIGESDIIATDVTVESQSRIICDFALDAPGYWHVVVKNTDGKADTLILGFHTVALPKPEIASIEPASHPACQEVHITDLAGSGFFPDAAVWLEQAGQADIAASNVVVESQNRITCDFSLTLRGFWDVLVRNVDGKSDTLPAGFYAIPLPDPEVVSITPVAARAHGSVYVSDLAGNDFLSGAGVSLQRSGWGEITAENVVVESAERITCGLGLPGNAVGPWNVVVANPDGGADTLAFGLEVLGSLWGGDTRLTSDSHFSSTSKPNAKCIALDSAGEPHVVWYDDRNGHYQIFYKRCIGGAWGADEMIASSSGDAEYPSIAVDSNDHIHVVWSDDRNGPWEIYYRLYDGIAWQVHTRLTEGPGNSNHPSIAVDDDDNLHVVWQNDDGGSPRIFYGSYDGAAWSLAGCIEPGVSGSATPSVAVDGFNHVHVVWYQDANPNDRLWYKTYDGMLWSEAVTLAVRNQIYGPTIAVDSRNMVHVAWHDARYGVSDYEVFHRRFDGLVWEPETRITEADENSHNASLAGDGAGNMYIVWADGRTGVNSIYYALNDGTGWGGDVLLAEASREVRLPSLAATADGGLHLVWRDERDGNPEIYYKSREADALSGSDEITAGVAGPWRMSVVPNPARATAEIRFHLAGETKSDLAIFDITGKLVSRIVLGYLPPGSHLVAWDLTGRTGRPVAAGVYFVSLRAGNCTRSSKVVVLR